MEWLPRLLGKQQRHHSQKDRKDHNLCYVAGGKCLERILRYQPQKDVYDARHVAERLIHLLRQLLGWEGLERRGNRRWLIKGTRRLFWRLIEDYPEKYRLFEGFQVHANPGEAEEPDDLLSAVVKLLERLDDKGLLESVLGPELRTHAGRELADWETAYFRGPFVPWWVRTRAPLEALEVPDGGTRDQVLNALDPAGLFAVFSAGHQEARGAAQILLMRDGFEGSSYAPRIGAWAMEQLRHKEKLDWQTYQDYPDEDIDLLMMCCPDLLIEQAGAMASQQPEQRTWLLDALLLFARQDGPWADRARALARQLALELGRMEPEA